MMKNFKIHFSNFKTKYNQSKHFSKMNVVYLALGSNLGKRFNNFQTCTKLIEEKGVGRVLKTSQIYESPCINENNQIVEEENKFINAVIKIETSLTPLDLLKACKEIEIYYKRKPKIKYYEEREIDIDIISYNDEVIDITDYESNLCLKIPHPKVFERIFVLKPMLEIDLNVKIYDMVSKEMKPVKNILKNLMNKIGDSTVHNFNPDYVNCYDKLSYIYKVFFMNSANRNTEKYFDVSRKTLLMATVNCTPDSFSIAWLKGESKPYDKIIEYILQFKDEIDIIDIGGESTRPGSYIVEENEEFNRILPLIEKIKSNDALKDIPISIDTRKSSVAKKCVNLGVDIINDVSAAQFDPEIANVVCEYNLKYICMHSRANPDIMQNEKFLKYNNITDDICNELESRINDINNKRGNNTKILDWNVIIDPGLGFSKTSENNFSVLKNLEEIKQKFPNLILIGHSKKKFIRDFLKVDKDHTLPGDIAVSCLAISKGANIIRIHDVENISKAIKISDKIVK
jgi:dihydropteroate synthase/2-amino-4-hydroxy-6-hydroxymethyldihydropteridine diphosphokinase